MSENRFIVTYRIQANSYEEAKQIAWGIQVEQTIEFPYEFVSDEHIKKEITGRLESLESMTIDSPYATVGRLCTSNYRSSKNEEDIHITNMVVASTGYYIARISYHVNTAGVEATQLMNVIFGNSSLQPHIWVVDIDLPASMYTVFKGPRFGLAGIRKLVHTPHRAMIQAVIKPMGTSNEELARMCAAYTRGGADVIKDDHGITNQPFSEFKDRVARCADAVQSMNARTGNHTLYAANISGDGADVLERAHYAKQMGATALMVAPGLVGFGWLRAIASDESLGLPIIAHPALGGGFVNAGVSGIADYLYLGWLPRLFGADMPIFVSYGGRFTFTREQCARISGYIKSENSYIKEACPAPGGGVTDARLDELVSLYGPDTMFLVGGDMFRRGPQIEDNMKYFVSRLTELSRRIYTENGDCIDG